MGCIYIYTKWLQEVMYHSQRCTIGMYRICTKITMHYGIEGLIVTADHYRSSPNEGGQFSPSLCSLDPSFCLQLVKLNFANVS